MGKTTLAFLICPVLGCGTGAPGGQAREPQHEEFPRVFAREGPSIEVMLVASTPRAVVFSGPGQLLVDSVTATGMVHRGDTLARLRDPMSAFAESRAEMELARAAAMGQTEIADSLRALLADPPWIAWALSPWEGSVHSVRLEALLSPGDTLGWITAPTESLWVLRSPVPLRRWPDVPGLVFLEVSPDTALVRGEPPDPPFPLPGTWFLPGTALRESGLRIFVLSASGDTITVEWLGEAPEGVLVFCERELDSLPLMPWSARRE